MYCLTNIACKFKYLNYERNQDLSFLIIFTIIIIIYYCLSKNNYLQWITEYKSQPKSYYQVRYTTAYTEILEKYFAFIVAYSVRDRYCVVIFQ